MEKYARLVVFVCLGIGMADAQRSSVKSFLVGGSLPARYLTQVASFGNQMNETRNYNLMLPPDNPWLCEYPAVYDALSENETEAINNTETSRYPIPVALFVSINSCSAEQKAKIAVEIQQRLISRLELLVIYSPDPRSNTLRTLKPDNDSHTDMYNSIGIVHIPYRYAAGIETRMRMVWTGSDPRFLLNDNAQWSFPIQISNYTRTGDDDDFTRTSRGSGGSSSNSRNIYFFRVVLFSLLVFSPCARACYLWYSGGGRFYFRRNENGWIVGLQYIPPSPAWLTTGRMMGGGAPLESQRASTISEEQFASLPEIEYKTIASHYDEDNEEAEEDGSETNKEEDAEGEDDIVVLKDGEYSKQNKEDDGEDKKKGGNSKDKEAAEAENNTTAVEETEGDSPPSADDADAMERGENSLEDSLACRSTMCSVCIDDFEEGEKIILLPRCQHGFHRDCIHPWLTERQGCCPFCKTDVFGENAVTEASGDDSPSNESAVDSQVASTDPEAPPTSEALPSDEASEEIGIAQRQPQQ